MTPHQTDVAHATLAYVCAVAAFLLAIWGTL